MSDARPVLEQAVDICNRLNACRHDQKKYLKELGEKLLPVKEGITHGRWMQLLAEYGINRHTWRRAKCLAEGREAYWKRKKQNGETHQFDRMVGGQLQLDELYRAAEAVRCELVDRIGACIEMVHRGNRIGMAALEAARGAMANAMGSGGGGVGRANGGVGGGWGGGEGA